MSLSILDELSADLVRFQSCCCVLMRLESPV